MTKLAKMSDCFSAYVDIYSDEWQQKIQKQVEANIDTVQNQQSRQTTNAVITCMPVLGSLEGVPGSPKTTKKKEGQEMPRLSLLARNAECHHTNAKAEPPGMSRGQGKDETKGEKDWR